MNQHTSMITKKRKENNLKKERKCVGFPCMKPMFPEAETYVSRMENVRSPPGKHKKQRKNGNIFL